MLTKFLNIYIFFLLSLNFFYLKNPHFPIFKHLFKHLMMFLKKPWIAKSFCFGLTKIHIRNIILTQKHSYFANITRCVYFTNIRPAHVYLAVFWESSVNFMPGAI